MCDAYLRDHEGSVCVIIGRERERERVESEVVVRNEDCRAWNGIAAAMEVPEQMEGYWRRADALAGGCLGCSDDGPDQKYRLVGVIVGSRWNDGR